MSSTRQQRKDSRRAGVNERVRKTPRLPLIPSTDTGEMVKRVREAGERRVSK
jgi:hypothetical protein